MTVFERFMLRGLLLVISLLLSIANKETINTDIDNECFVLVKDITKLFKTTP